MASPNPNPNPILDGILTLALPAPTSTAAATTPTPPPPQPSSSARRFPSPCWTHDETLALIDSYREKWLSLRRGNLRATHWQEVADAVALRCPVAVPKTAVQCRHKVEKLRKRYRVERQRSLRVDPNSPPASSWVFFRRMEAMDPNPTPAPAAPPAPNPPPSSSASSDESSSSSEANEDDTGAGEYYYHSRMANGGGLGFKIPNFERPRPGFATSGVFRGYPVMGQHLGAEKRKREGGGGGGVGCEIAAAVRMLGDGFMRMEQMKMDMTREFEKVRMEMELKRTQMILDSHRRIVDAFVKGFVGKKRAKISHQS